MRPPQTWQSARVTLVIAAVTALAWIAVLVTGQQEAAADMGGFIPARLNTLHGTDLALALLLRPLTAALIHSGIVHIGFNLVVLLFCGRLVETILGARSMIILYVLGAYAAAAAHYLASPHGAAPMVGASGAISSVIGASAMLYGRNRVNVANPLLARWLHALWLLAAWIVLNLMMGFSFQLEGITIAVAAHIGGFLVGLALAKPLLLLRWRGA